jgi:hypothetical protein
MPVDMHEALKEDAAMIHYFAMLDYFSINKNVMDEGEKNYRELNRKGSGNGE